MRAICEPVARVRSPATTAGAAEGDPTASCVREFVADAVDGEHVARTAWIGFELPSSLVDREIARSARSNSPISGSCAGLLSSPLDTVVLPGFAVLHYRSVLR